MPGTMTDQSGALAHWPGAMLALGVASLLSVSSGCKSPEGYRAEADDVAGEIIAQKQRDGLGREQPLSI